MLFVIALSLYYRFLEKAVSARFNLPYNSAGKKEKPNNVTIEVKVYKTLSKRSFLLFSYSTYDLMVFFKTLQKSHGYIFSPN